MRRQSSGSASLVRRRAAREGSLGERWRRGRWPAPLVSVGALVGCGFGR
jgi:hypothetical protein